MAIFEIVLIPNSPFPSSILDTMPTIRVIKLHGNDNRYIVFTMFPSTFIDLAFASKRIASIWRLDSITYDNGYEFRRSGYQVK